MPELQRIPGATTIYESRVLPCSIEAAWEAIRPLNFTWLKSVKDVKVVEGKDAEGDKFALYHGKTELRFSWLSASCHI